MFESFVILFVGVAYLVVCAAGFWYWRIRRRMPTRPPENQRVGHGMDVTLALRSVNRVRGNHASTPQAHVRSTCRHRVYLLTVRKAIGSLGFCRKHTQGATGMDK